VVRPYEVMRVVRLVTIALCLGTASCMSASSVTPQAPSSGGQWAFVSLYQPDPHISAKAQLLAFAPPLPYGQPATIWTGFDYPFQLATDSSGNLFAAFVVSYTIGIFAKPYSAGARVLHFPGLTAFALDRANDLFVVTFHASHNNRRSWSNIAELRPPYTRVIKQTTNLPPFVESIFLDSRSNIYLTTQTGLTSAVLQLLAPSYKRVGASLKNASVVGVTGADQLVVVAPSDKYSGTVYCCAITVAAYSIDGTRLVPVHSPVTFGKVMVSEALAPSGDVFAGSICCGVYELAAPGYGSVSHFTSLSAEGAGLLAVDDQSRLFSVGTNSSGKLAMWISSYPYSGIEQTIALPANGDSSPAAIALGVSPP
jgi:hypothetical protein